MNKIYKLKFDKRRNELVVVSEITAGMGKEKSTGHLADLSALSPFRKLLGTLTPLALLTGLIAGLLPAMVLAADLPTGGQIVGGQGSISSAGNQMTIHQQTQNMATNWHSFDIGKNNTVQFIQPDSSAVALNRVTGVSGSQIMGTLKANGQVFILNPNGVLFGKDARVNVAGLVASTKNINTADFMKGQYTLSGSGNPGAQVINQGSLTTTKGGYIVLAGERVSNSGTITTPSGKTVLAAGKTVTLQLDNGGLTSVRVNGSVVNALVENRGLISATNGQVYLTAQGRDMLMNTVVNNSGTIEAKGLESRGGEIVLNGGDSGVVSQSGRVLADSLTGKGGKITLEGQNIHLAGNSLTSATGKTGGGEVYVGGGWQGKDSHIHNASKVVMDRSATVDVSATQNGNGGTAVLWSDDYTSFQGGILARGGAQSGNGGRVETSSHRNLQAFGAVGASARAGHGGEWLLDPTDVTIVSGDANTAVTESGKGTEATLDMDTEHVFSPSATGAQVSADKISEQLNAGTNVTVQTSGADTDGQSGNITVNANISKSAGADASLTLAAGGNITLDGHSITATAGKLDVSLLAAGYDSERIQMLNGSQVNTSGGNITLDQLNHTTVTEDGSMVNSTRALTLKITGGSTLNATSSGGESGDISLGVYNPNVNLSAPAYNGTVRNGGSMAEISGNSVLNGGNISLHSEQSGADASALPFFLNQMTVNASGDIVFSARATGGSNVANAEIRGANNALTAKGNISLTAELSGSSGSAIWIHGGKVGDIQLTAGKGIVLTGIKPGRNDGLFIQDTAFSAGDRLMVTGSAATGGGVIIRNSTLNASQAVITGTTTGGNTGFSVTGTTLSGGLADLANVTFSSAGSAAGAINLLDSSVVNEANRENLLAKRIENMTSIDMGGTAIFDDSSATDKGWSHDYTLEDLPNHGWIFNNTSVNAGGLVQLAGVGFSNATMNITAGGLNISQSGPLQLTSTTMNVNGDVLLHSDMDLTLTGSRVNETAAGDAAVNITAGQNITLSGTNISATTGKIDVSLLAAGADSGRIQVLNGSQVNTRGGNITLDQLNHTTATEDGSVSNPNAMTVKVNNSKLNTSAPAATDGTASESGNITLNAYNPNVNLSAPAYNTTVRNAGAMLELSGNSTLTGRDLIMRTTLEGGNATGLPVFLNNATLNASHDITLSGVAHPVTTNTTADDGTVTTNTTTPALAAIELRGAGNVLTAGSNITIENPASGNRNGVYLNGNASGKAQLTAGGTITLNGSSAGNGAGVLVNNSILNASQAVITGSSSTGKGFSLTNTTLEGSLTDLVNVTFSSAGAGAGVTNLLDGSVVTSSNRDTMLGKSIENMTSIDMGGTAIFDDSAATDKGWTHNYTHADNPNGGWIFNNTTVNAGGDVDVKGAGFTNSTVNVSSGNLSIDNNSAALLTGTTITVGDGAVNVHAGAGNIDLSKGNISAKGDITLQTDNGSISISGTNATQIASITSDSGNISITSNTETGNALTFNYVGLNAQEGNISISGVSSNSNGVVIRNTNIHGNARIYGETSADQGNTFWGNGIGGVAIDGVNISSGNVYIHGVSHGRGMGVYLWSGTNQINESSVLDIYGETKSDNDAWGYSSGVVFSSIRNANPIFINNGVLNITGVASSSSGKASGINMGLYNQFSPGASQNSLFNFSGSGSVAISGHAVLGNGVAFGNGLTALNNVVTVNGSSLKGYGVVLTSNTSSGSNANLMVTGTTDSGDAGVLVNHGSISSEGDHVFSISGHSNGSGAGVMMSSGYDNSITRVDVNATSVNGSGLVVNNKSQITDSNVTAASENQTGIVISGALNGGTATGVSKNGTGVQLSGNARVENITLKGESTAGSGVLVSGANTTVDGATISGNTSSGVGVNISGSLTNVNGTTVNGSAADGSGVTLGGNLSGGEVTGTSQTGSGVNITGDNSVADNTTLKGSSTSGTGVTISGNLTNTNGTTVNGTTSGSGSGVELSGNVTGGSVTGSSESGAGVYVTGADSTVDNVILTGSTGSGSGISVSGGLTSTGSSSINGSADSGAGITVNGTVNQGTLNGNSTSGPGIVFDDGANITHDATVSGNSISGSGAVINGNVSNDGNITGTSEKGAGATVSGNLSGSGQVSGLALGSGAGIRTEGHVNVSGSQLRGNSVNGIDLVVSGTLSHDPDTTIEAETVTGQENIQEVKPVTPPPATEDDGSQPGHDTDSGNTNTGSDNPAVDRPSVPSEPESQSERDPDASLRKEAEVNSLRQGAVNAQFINMNQPSQDGFHASGTSPVPVKGYLPPERKVDISLCDGENCRSVSLNAARAAEGNVTPSGR
ncbi:filamentous hemagglutinin N-terminal domain-containing protein [Salmonella enterica subsp. enterica serovar Poona]|nr:filamentous hemagglutinin N-terminal domain-containing protein [Salmonella enterica subsp. enterica serovar Poona]